MKAAFMEQDGVLYPRIAQRMSPIEVAFFPGSPKALSGLSMYGYLLAFVNNWPSESGRQVYKMMAARLSRKIHRFAAGGKEFAGCFHDEAEECYCRMPKTGMLDKLIKQYNLDIAQCVFFAGSLEGAGAAQKAGIEKVYILKTGVKYYKDKMQPGLIRAKDLAGAVKMLGETFQDAAVAS